MFNYTPNEIASQLMNNDEQLQSHLTEMKHLKETMYSLEQNSGYNKNTSNSINNNNSEMASVGNAICQLSGKIEERKNILKTNLFHSYEMFSKQGGSNLSSLNTSAANFNTSIDKQPLATTTTAVSNATPDSGSSSEYNSMVYPVVSSTNTSNLLNNHKQDAQMMGNSNNNSQMQHNSVNTKNNFVQQKKQQQSHGKYTAGQTSAKHQFSQEKSDEESEDEDEVEFTPILIFYLRVL